MSEDPLGRADEVGAAGLVSRQGHDDGRGEGERHSARDGRPTGQGWPLEREEAEEAPEEALDGAALGQLGGRPGGGEAGQVLGALGVEGCDPFP
ncbi:MAG TPA: hypothetical protein VFE42_00335 [Chloroflexota bacterium]|nr:hypothetical protein [Chloroflexota bacterium]